MKHYLTSKEVSERQVTIKKCKDFIKEYKDGESSASMLAKAYKTNELLSDEENELERSNVKNNLIKISKKFRERLQLEENYSDYLLELGSAQQALDNQIEFSKKQTKLMDILLTIKEDYSFEMSRFLQCIAKYAGYGEFNNSCITKDSVAKAIVELQIQ